MEKRDTKSYHEPILAVAAQTTLLSTNAHTGTAVNINADDVDVPTPTDIAGMKSPVPHHTKECDAKYHTGPHSSVLQITNALIGTIQVV